MGGVQIIISRAALAYTMGAMRRWLDSHGNPDVRFATAADERGILINVDFSSPDLALAFQREFGGPLLRAA